MTKLGAATVTRSQRHAKQASLRSELPELAIVGAGTYGYAIGELAETCGFRVVGFLDDDRVKSGRSIQGLDIMVPIRENLAMLPLNVSVAVAIGANEVRRDYLNMAQGFGLRTPPLISPHAVISSSATVEEACFVHVGCHVWTAAMIGYGSILSPHATVAHHTRLGTACFVSTGAHVGASIIVEEEVLIGIGATVSTGVARLGRGCLVGAGAVVIRDTKPDGVYVGNPARLISPIAGSEA